MPVTIKDLAVTADLPTQRGSMTMKGEVFGADTLFVTRLREAGAVVLGKTTTSEFGWKGQPRAADRHHPQPLETWLQRRCFLGRCGVAGAGYGPLHQGSDGAGSIRMPSHFAAFSVSNRASAGELAGWKPDQVSHNGLMTRSVGSRVDAENHGRAPSPRPLLAGKPAGRLSGSAEKDLGGLRVAYSPTSATPESTRKWPIWWPRA